MSDNNKNGNDADWSAASNKTRVDQLPTDSTVFRRKDASSDTPQQRAGVAPRLPVDASHIPPSQPDDQPKAPPPNDNHATIVRQHRPAGNDATRLKPAGLSGIAPNSGLQDKGHTPTRPIIQSPGNVASHPSTPHAAPLGVLKGRFTLEKIIGAGGMGVVYKATDRLKIEAHDQDPHVAIKVLSEEFKSHPEAFIALQRESRKTQRIAHPNVVKVYDFDRDDDIVFMTMEYMEGQPLDQLIKQYSATGLPHDDAWSIMYGLCSALIHAHEEKIVHSDFKPGNIFVTDGGIPKIFDFGIARAVANIDRSNSKSEDRTVFDAGSLGALTPAYASMEMLIGKEPDVRDDIYALGCIAYEMLTGEHPFNRIPADEAYTSKLKPRRIPGLKKRQWKAIEKALAFRREDRLNSVDEFYHLIQPKRKRVSIFAATTVVLTAIGLSTYFIVSNTPTPEPQPTIQVDEIEFKIRYDLFKEKIERLINEPSFSPDWENAIWDEISGMTDLQGSKPDEWLLATTRKVYVLYISKYNELLQDQHFDRAQTLLDNAYRYASDTQQLNLEKQKLSDLVRQNAELARQDAEHKKALAEANHRAQQARDARSREETDRQNTFDLALRNLNQQLQCTSNLNMRDFGIAIDKVRSLDSSRYADLQNNIIVALAECIAQTGKSQPERALEAKSYALRIFPNNTLIADISITPRDACDRSLAGLGQHRVCRDNITGGGTGPAMVVIPGNGKLPVLAIGKYEVSVSEINQYCNATRSCNLLDAGGDGMPAVNISVNIANGYVRWLTNVTQQRYRIPTHEEWMHAANATNSSHDANRNCQLNTRGMEKGGQLVRSNTGAPNGWGVVNYLGNAREWVFDQGRDLLAVGGSFDDPMDRCTVNAAEMHSGNADSTTGFRVVREIAAR